MQVHMNSPGLALNDVNLQVEKSFYLSNTFVPIVWLGDLPERPGAS